MGIDCMFVTIFIWSIFVYCTMVKVISYFIRLEDQAFQSLKIAIKLKSH